MQAITQIALDWAVRCFGWHHVNNCGVRTLRTAEEAIELVQAAGVSKEKVIELVNIVYSRPVGTLDREIGGVLLTTTILCGSMHRDPSEFLETELRRVLSKPTEHFAKRNQEKVDLGLW